jgi:hypothetical protein
LHGAEQDYRACNGQCESKHKTCADRPAHEHGKAKSHQSCDNDLDDSSGHGDGSDGQKIMQRKMQTDSEHQKNDA